MPDPCAGEAFHVEGYPQLVSVHSYGKSSSKNTDDIISYSVKQASKTGNVKLEFNMFFVPLYFF